MIRKIYAHIINMHQGKLLKDEVRRRGLSDVKFAEMCGVSRQTVSVWYGRYDLSVKSKEMIIAALQLQENFFTGKETKEYSINTDPSHILTANERQALWDIIQAQKDVIDNLRRQLKDTDDSKD